MDIKEYFESKRKYKTKDLYLGSLVEVYFDSFSQKKAVKFCRFAILRKLSKRETYQKLRKKFYYEDIGNMFWEFVPEYLKNGYLNNSLDFYVGFNNIHYATDEHGLYVQTRPTQIIQDHFNKSNKMLADHLLLANYIIINNIIPLKNIETDSFKLLSQYNVDNIIDLEDYINDCYDDEIENYNM